MEAVNRPMHQARLHDPAEINKVLSAKVFSCSEAPSQEAPSPAQLTTRTAGNLLLRYLRVFVDSNRFTDPTSFLLRDNVVDLIFLLV